MKARRSALVSKIIQANLTMHRIVYICNMMTTLRFRSQGKEKEAERLLKDSIHFGPHFADAYSSLASLYAEQVNHPDVLVDVWCHSALNPFQTL